MYLGKILQVPKEISDTGFIEIVGKDENEVVKSNTTAYSFDYIVVNYNPEKKKRVGMWRAMTNDDIKTLVERNGIS